MTDASLCSHKALWSRQQCLHSHNLFSVLCQGCLSCLCGTSQEAPRKSWFLHLPSRPGYTFLTGLGSRNHCCRRELWCGMLLACCHRPHRTLPPQVVVRRQDVVVIVLANIARRDSGCSWKVVWKVKFVLPLRLSGDLLTVPHHVTLR